MNESLETATKNEIERIEIERRNSTNALVHRRAIVDDELSLGRRSNGANVIRTERELLARIRKRARRDFALDDDRIRQLRDQRCGDA